MAALNESEIESEVLSDVHVVLKYSEPWDECQDYPKQQTKPRKWLSRYFFSLPSATPGEGHWVHKSTNQTFPHTFHPYGRCESQIPAPSQELQTAVSSHLDSDGDWILERRHMPDFQLKVLGCKVSMKKSQDGVESGDAVLTLEHCLETSLENVGYQLWSGALLLCDYLINNQHLLEASTVLDLGAGTGLTSIVAAMFARKVICTDYTVSIVEMAERNWHRNKDTLPQRTCEDILFKVLDWNNDWMSGIPETSIGHHSLCTSRHDFTSSDLRLLDDINIILAAEVIYDEDLTDAFFKTVYNLLLKSPPKNVYLSLERRTVFTEHNREACSPAYEHFQENLQDLASVDEGPVVFTYRQVSTEFPQYFKHYQRVKELELWNISSHVRGAEPVT